MILEWINVRVREEGLKTHIEFYRCQRSDISYCVLSVHLFLHTSLLQCMKDMNRAAISELCIVLIKHGTSDVIIYWSFVLADMYRSELNKKLNQGRATILLVNYIFPKVQCTSRYGSRNYIVLALLKLFCLAANFSVLIIFSVLKFYLTCLSRYVAFN